MDFEILTLGPVGLRVNGRRDALGSTKERTMLAALAVDIGQAVSIDTLTHRVWDDDPPRKPRASLHTYAARLRHRFREALDRDPLVQQAHTYCLDLAPELVDCHRFRRLVTRARAREEHSATEALDAFQEAVELWRGEPLAGMTGTWAESVRTSLESRHLAALLGRTALEQRLGRFADTVGDLTVLLEQHPTDETVAQQLMLAHYGCGRQPDALRVFATIRKRMLTEFGTEPGESLARLHHLVLNQAPLDEMIGRRRRAATSRRSPNNPNNVPAHNEMIGRRKELALLESAPRKGAVVALQGISGMAGIGKSLLAFHAARALEPRYPDGAVHLDLHGHSARRKPLTPVAALTGLLRTLGVPSSAVPHTFEELVALWRSLMESRRTVVILDDAAGPEQVRPLLPLDSPALVLITSRKRLTGLPGVRPVFLDVLPYADAAALFCRIVGTERSGDPGDVARVVELCGHLPLAIELAAGRLNSRPSWTTRHLARKLSGTTSRLGEIRNQDSGIERAFELSYRTLTPQQQSAFRLFGLHFGPAFGPFAAAALGDLPVETAERHLDALLESNLLGEPEPDRYRFHDLLGEYALTLAHEHPAHEEAAQRRLTRFYLAAAAHADTLAHPRPAGRLDTGPLLPAERLPRFADAHEARQWLTGESAALVAAEHHARTHGEPRTAALLAHVLAAFLDTEGLWDEAAHMHRHAVHHWHTTGDVRAEALAHLDLAATHAHSGAYAQAADADRNALRLARSAGDTACAAEALHQLGILHWHRGEYPAMLDALGEALGMRTHSGDRWNRARSTNTIGIAHLHTGNHPAAFRHFREALLAFRELGDARGEAQALNNLADAQMHSGDHESARQLLSRVLAIMLESGSRSEQATARLNLGTATPPEHAAEALSLYEEALTSFRQLGDRRNETITHLALGEALRRDGRHEEAGEHHARALVLARSLGAGLEEVQAMRALGVSEHHSGSPAGASEHLEAALELAVRLRSPEEEARTCDALAALRRTQGRTAEAVRLWRRAAEAFRGIDEGEVARVEGLLGTIEAQLPH
ncbi:AfsR/SARP family transcriptional regulator [Streptomyces cacaoi]|uniref:AfsR/SARP family transcriptional regulator n=1 Tax=Streptomyces cacaoi TaxID=1898 RepID=UPI003316FF9B